MDYEKEYKKLKADIEKAYLFAQTDSTKAVLEHILPELAKLEDERIRKCLITVIKIQKEGSFGLECNHGASWNEMLAWLEKQAPKTEWSEEDEKMFNSALWHIKNSCSNGGKNSGEFEVYNWLKSLKQRHVWKPSEEQIGVIEAVINNRSFQRRHLDSLYEQLKKLQNESN